MLQPRYVFKTFKVIYPLGMKQASCKKKATMVLIVDCFQAFRGP